MAQADPFAHLRPTKEEIMEGKEKYMQSKDWNVIATNRRILEDEIEWDLILVAENGAELKCHRTMLVAHGQYWALKVMDIPQHGRLPFPTTPEETLRAFLYFVYCDELPWKNMNLAMALLKFGDEHKVPAFVNLVIELTEKFGELDYSYEYAIRP